VKNILIISSKKYTKLKNYTDFVSLIKSRKLEFHISFVEDVEQYDNYLNKDTLVVNKSENIEQILDEWIEGKSHINNRKAIIQDNNLKSPAFNEIVLIKNSPTRILDIVFKTHDQTVKLRADGIIISTSLGSTAYNYSAGGPIVQNSLNSIIITPISPFSKFPRSIVLDQKSKIQIEIKKKQNYAIQFDGVVESEVESDKDNKLDYTLSEKSLHIIGTDNSPRLDLFLNQILR